jgi:hypothetical protein
MSNLNIKENKLFYIFQVILEGEHYHGHIQEISAEDNTAVVFIHELGEK